MDDLSGNTKKKAVAALAAAMLIISFFAAALFAQAQAPTIESLQALLADLLRQLAALEKLQSGPVSAPACAITPPLRRGMRGEGVACAQQFLIAQQLLPANSATGFFGPLTEAAVKQFQAREGIVSAGSPTTTGYGAIGVRTHARIQALRTPSLPPLPGPAAATSTTPIALPPNGTSASGAAATSTSSLGGGGIPPPPPQSNTPSCILSASSASVPSGTSFTLSWTTAKATGAAEIRQGNSPLLYQPALKGGRGGTLPNGSQKLTVGAPGTYTYTMSVSNASGESTCSAVITATGTAMIGELPVVRSGLGLASFADTLHSSSDLVKRDIIWGSSEARAAPFGGYYVPANREPMGAPNQPGTHDEAWYLANHPDWLVYQNDRVSLAHSFRYGAAPNYWYLMPIDISNPAVQDYIWERRIAPTIARGFKAITFDNVEPINSYKRAGVKTSSGWKQLYNPANSHDPAYTASLNDFLRVTRARLHAAGVLSMGNINYGYGYEQELLMAAREMDLVFMEGSFLHLCDRNNFRVNDDSVDSVADRSDYWTRRFTSFRAIAKERGLILADICYNSLGSIASLPAEDVSWAIANYLLVREDRTYMLLTYIEEASKRVDRPEYEKAEKIGAPIEEPQKQNGVWTRRYEKGLVVVNPSAKSQGSFALGGGIYRDLAGRERTGTIAIPPATGLVLFKEAEIVPIPAWVPDNAKFVPVGTGTWLMTENATTSRHRLNVGSMALPGGHTTSEVWTLSLLAKPAPGSAPRRLSVGILGVLEQAGSAATAICNISGQGGIAWSGKGALASALKATGGPEADGWYSCSLRVKPNALGDKRLRLMLELFTETSVGAYAGDGSSSLLFKDIRLDVRPEE